MQSGLRQLIYLAGLVTGLIPSLAMANEEKVPLAQQDFSLALVNMLSGLAIVLALLLFIYFLAKRFLPKGMTGASSGMKIVGRLAVGPRKHIALVEVGEKVLVLGVTADRINLLTTLDERPESLDEKPLSGGKGNFLEAFKLASAKKEKSS